jgi:hypothetical protein
MKLQSCLMIKCIALNAINIQELLYKLENYTKKYFPQATINLVTNEPYWKYPECNTIIYNLVNDQLITVAAFIKHLPLSWQHKKINSEEDAVWSQSCYPEEFFLMPEIEWVHMYTWEEDKESTNN